MGWREKGGGLSQWNEGFLERKGSECLEQRGGMLMKI